MSRTTRRKVVQNHHKLIKWELRDYTHYPLHFQHDPKSKEGKRRLAVYHSDTGTHNFKEPGPSWFRNLFTERTQRREAKRQCNLYLRDTEYVVILNSKDPLEYWT